MTDREMLELAAKAAGIGTLVWGDKYKLGDDEIDCTDISYIRSEQPDEGDVHWNPLTDDGDALRLAVKLGLLISHSAYKPGENAYGFIGIAWYGQRVEFKPEKFTDDPYAATRRAIVRAAAEIGRSMT